MKRILKYFIFIITFLTTALLVSNCSSDDNDGNPTEPAAPGHDPKLVGKWELVEAYIPSMNLTVSAEQIGISLIAEFNADGNYTMTSTDSTGVPEVEKGTWTTANGNLTLKNSDDGSEEEIQYTITGDIGILKSTYEITEDNEIPADYKFKSIK